MKNVDGVPHIQNSWLFHGIESEMSNTSKDISQESFYPLLTCRCYVLNFDVYVGKEGTQRMIHGPDYDVSLYGLCL